MSTTAEVSREPLPRLAEVTLDHAFADRLPELAIPWQAAPVPRPRAVILNERLADELGLDPSRLAEPEGLEFLVGRRLAVGSEPVAQLYAGHQFGAYSPMLGDGRALLLGEVRSRDGRLLDMHLKGSGPTPPSRGDGFAALGPMLREYVMGEAMHALGIPTSRALAVVSTGRPVHRDDFARDDRLPGAVLTRIAASHLRIGTFQLAGSRGDLGLLQRLVAFALERHGPEVIDTDEPALALFQAVVRRQAELTAQWMLVGFVHGVMNTDNVMISGETIDYGPCAFLDVYEPSAVFSSIDQGGRYAFGAQPAVAKWNLARFAESLLPIMGEPGTALARAEAALATFDAAYTRTWGDGMAAKLGLRHAGKESRGLADEWLEILEAGRIDYTAAFRALTSAAGAGGGGDVSPRDRVSSVAARARAELGVDHGEGHAEAATARARRLDAWLARWAARDPEAALMARVNPVTIPRNHALAAALDAATDGDLAPVTELLDAVTHPYEQRPEWSHFAGPAPASAGRFVTTCGT